jgi:hypothetical protein
MQVYVMDSSFNQGIVQLLTLLSDCVNYYICFINNFVLGIGIYANKQISFAERVNMTQLNVSCLVFSLILSTLKCFFFWDVCVLIFHTEAYGGWFFFWYVFFCTYFSQSLCTCPNIHFVLEPTIFKRRYNS